jgi:tetratricopeptide (TPR) repeat protein
MAHQRNRIRAATVNLIRAATVRERFFPVPAPNRCLTVAALTQAIALIIACAPLNPAGAQDQESGADVTRMVDAGMVEALQARFGAQPATDQLRLLAIAHANKAALQTADAACDADFRAARRRYEAWITAIGRDAQLDPTKREVDAAGARIALSAMILMRWAAPDLDRNEITNGAFDSADRLESLLRDAGALLDQALAALDPLAEAIAAGDPDTEERFLALGIYDAVRRLRFEGRFHLGHCRLYLASLPQSPAKERLNALRDAERLFQSVINAGTSGDAAARAQLGLAVTLRRQGRFDEARQYYDAALKLVDEGPVAARARVERAGCEIDAGRFQDARLGLDPLVSLDPANLAADQQASRFYVNLAHVWDANSYLLEADRLSQVADAPPGDAVARRARAIRDQGLVRMNRLAARGGPWPELVALYVGSTFDPRAPIDSLTPAELLFAARDCAQRGDHAAAQERLRAALARETGAELTGEIVFELAGSLAITGETREAAQLFDRLVREHAQHPKSEQATTHAYQLWARIAEDGGDRADYLRLSDALRALLRHHPRHEHRLDATWWLPLALERGGEFEQAAAHYASVPAESPHWEEARYRRVVCRRRAWQANRDTASAQRIADELHGYAIEAYARASNTADPAAVRAWAARALLESAEVCLPVDGGFNRALTILDAFDVPQADATLAGRALGVRILALRGLGKLDEASRVARDALDRLSPDESAPVLALLASAVLDQLDRFEADDVRAEARALATAALDVFERLEARSRETESSASTSGLDAARFALARVRYAAGKPAEARIVIESLLESQPNRGDYRRLQALVLTALVGSDGRISRTATAQTLAAAKDAWAKLLSDRQLLHKAPQRYWEARYQFLRLLLAQGKAAEVVAAIEQERVWRPELGGPPWRARLEQLLADARQTAR